MTSYKSAADYFLDQYEKIKHNRSHDNLKSPLYLSFYFSKAPTQTCKFKKLDDTPTDEKCRQISHMKQESHDRKQGG